MTRDSKESVLSRWSRRKLEAEQGADKAPAPPAVDAPPSIEEIKSHDAADADTALQPEAEAPPLTDADMPDIDSLTEDSDFSPFMSAGVSDELRNLALRKLFHAPVFNIRDGLDEYDDDFTQFEKLGSIITSDMKHRLEMEQEKLRERLAEEETEADADGALAEAADEYDEVDEVEEIDDDDDELPALAAADHETRRQSEAKDEQ